MNDDGAGLREQVASWADRLRDLAATGLHFAQDSYDIQRYVEIRRIALEMLDASTATDLGSLAAIELKVFSRMTPYSAAAGAVIDDKGKVLLIRRTDDGLWSMPA
jgi:hypothetical protein